jgi:hypothetical protein
MNLTSPPLSKGEGIGGAPLAGRARAGRLSIFSFGSTRLGCRSWGEAPGEARPEEQTACRDFRAPAANEYL